eukprot:gene15517-17383_t
MRFIALFLSLFPYAIARLSFSSGRARNERLLKHSFDPVSFDPEIQNQVNSEANWGPCPPSQFAYGIGYLKDCITLQFPLDRSNPSLGTVNAFLRRLYAGSAPTNTTLWLLEGGPGFSTRGFIPAANYFINQNQNLTAYLLDARGTGLSSLLTCNTSGYNPGFYFNPFNRSTIQQYKTCNDEIISKYSNVSQYYDTYNSALDFLDVVNFINPETIAIYAFSYGSFFTNTYLQLPGARADCLIFDGPTPPDRWVLENSAMMSSWASQDVINLCVANSSVCSDALGVMGNLPQLIAQAVKDRTLPCVKKLWWLNDTDGYFRLAQFTNYMTSTEFVQVLMGPFWYRLYRCTDSDVQQLNNFYHVRTSEMGPNTLSIYDYSYGLGTNIGANELYSFEGNTSLTYLQQVLNTNRLFSTGGGELSTSYAIYESNFTKYQPNATYYLKYANITVPTLLLSGNLDPETVQGLGLWFQNGINNNQTTFLSIPYASHGVVNQEALCVDSIVSSFINQLGQGSLNTSCLDSLQVPDFDGSEFETQSIALQYFGTTDLWNNDYQKDVTPDTPTCTTIIYDNSNGNSWSQDDVNILIIALTVPCGVIILALIGYILFLQNIFSLPSKKPPLASEVNI